MNEVEFASRICQRLDQGLSLDAATLRLLESARESALRRHRRSPRRRGVFVGGLLAAIGALILLYCE